MNRLLNRPDTARSSRAEFRVSAATPASVTEVPVQVRSVAMLIPLAAIVPSIFVVVPMVLVIIVAFAWPNQTAGHEPDQTQ
jgi:hypothetical protein